MISELIANFDIMKIVNAGLTQEDLDEIAEAEKLMKRFLSWDVDGTLTSIREVLAELLIADQPDGKDTRRQEARVEEYELDEVESDRTATEEIND
jgi:hypothetical protein